MMKRIYHPFWTWEDIGMWRRVWGKNRAVMLERAVEFTGDAERYGAAMLRVLEEFPIAAEHNLTDVAQNRQAWIGHAACYLALDIPEDIVREAWGMLTQDQRDAANAVADIAIAEWEARYEEKNQYVHQQMALPGIPGRFAGRSSATA
jgi:hypothetical protein